MSRVSIVIPTVTGREKSLERCVDSYKATLDGHTAEFIIVRDRPTCGQAWSDGAEAATGEYLHITADDLEAKPGWLTAALDCLASSAIPSPILELPGGGYDGDVLPDGVAARMTPLPFIRTEWWPGCPDIHYWSDFLVSDRLLAQRRRIRWCHGYRFVHHRQQDVARNRMERRFAEDREVYLAEVNALNQGVAA